MLSRFHNAPVPSLAETFARRDNHFDLLRLVMAALVIVHHSPVVLYLDRGRAAIQDPLAALTGGRLDLGSMAVYGFFAISGFLITASWEREPHLLPYLRKRVARIYPAFVAMVGICVLMVGPLGTPDMGVYLRSLRLSDVLGGMAFLHMPSMPGVFAELPSQSVNVSAWTIAHEFRCYLLVALLGLLGAFRRRALSGILLASLVLIFAWTTRPGTPLPHGGSLSLAFGIELWPPLLTWFVAGVVFYLYRDRVPVRLSWFVAACVGGVASVMGKQVALLPIFGTYALLYTAVAPRGSTRWVRRFGDLSYGVYLYGWPVQQLLRMHFPDTWTPATLSLCALAISMGLAGLSWRFAECRFLKSRSTAYAATDPPSRPSGVEAARNRAAFTV